MATANHSKPLTSKGINALKPKSTGYRVPDVPFSGLNVAVLVSGSKKWVLSYTSPQTGKRCLWTFGTYPSVELSEARKRVTQYRKLIADGIDPRLQDRQQKAEQIRQSSMATVSDVLSLYIEDLKLDAKGTYKDVESKLKKYIAPRIGNLPAKSLTVQLAAEALGDIQAESSPNIAKRCRGYLSTAWGMALGIEGNIRWAKSASNYGLDANPFLLIKPPQNTENTCDRFLTKEEISFFWHNATPDKIDAQLALVIKFLLSTGQRPLEVLYARWSDFDLEAGLWVQPWDRRKSRHKSRHDHIIPLNSFHKSLLKQIKTLSNDSSYLFPSSNTTQDTPRSKDTLSRTLRNFCSPKNAPQRMKPFFSKSMRKTVKTQGIKIGIPKESLDRLQGHSVGDISNKHYNKHDYATEKLAAMQQWTDWLQTVIDGTERTKGSKIVLLSDLA